MKRRLKGRRRNAALHLASALGGIVEKRRRIMSGMGRQGNAMSVELISIHHLKPASESDGASGPGNAKCAGTDASEKTL